VRRVIEPMILGDSPTADMLSDDYSYVRDLGLIRDDRGKTVPGNPIYAEVMTRTLNWNTQADITARHPEYELPRYIKDGQLDMDFLLKDFQAYWRENSGIWQERYDYKEAAPHLVMMAFMQRVINSGGQIIREYAASTGRTDLCLVYGGRKYPVELKLRYGEASKAEGLAQVARYMDVLGAQRGWLVIFDRREGVSWEEKNYFSARGSRRQAGHHSWVLRARRRDRRGAGAPPPQLQGQDAPSQRARRRLLRGTSGLLGRAQGNEDQ